MTLEPLEIANGIFSIIFVSISILVGLTIALKYFKYKKITFILVGFTWIGIVLPWTPSSISILMFLTTGTIPIIEILLFVALFFLPFTLIFWLTAYTFFMDIEKRTLILVIFAIVGALFEIIFLYLLFTNPSAIGEFSGKFDMNYRLFVNIFLFFLLIVVITTGTSFALKSLRSKDPELKLKGKLLLLAFYSFVLGSILDIFSGISITVLTVARIILILSALEFYAGFILPNWMKKIFLRQK